MTGITIEALLDNIGVVEEFVGTRLKELGCSRKARRQIFIALDELFSNICNYAYDDGDGRCHVDVEELGPDRIKITLKDYGVPFNPLAHVDPDVTLGLEDRGVGGMGILMVKRLMDDVTYEYADGVNVLTVTKEL